MKGLHACQHACVAASRHGDTRRTPPRITSQPIDSRSRGEGVDVKMHEGQVELSASSVQRLVATQLPQWRGFEVRPLASDGTVNALFRLGDEIVLRFPLEPSPGEARRESLLREQAHARRIGPHTRLEVPEPLALGAPGPGYGGWWTAYRWIDGEPVGEADVAFARDLAEFVRALRDMDTGGQGWDGHSRGGPLAVRDAGVRKALRASQRLVDVDELTRAWERSLAATPYSGPGLWLHADLMPGNLLVRRTRLAAVIDLGAVCIGDPAVDLMPAWNLLATDARAAYRTFLDDDDATWERGRGWAIAQAIVALPYYVDTNPAMADVARRTLLALT